MSRDQKERNVSEIKDQEKRLLEIKFCVLRDRSCHRFKIIFERADTVQPEDYQVKFDHIVEWKRERFKENGSCCTLLADIFGEGVLCPFGHSTREECKAHIRAVRAFLIKNGKKNVSELDFYLRGCFDVITKIPKPRKENGGTCFLRK